MGVTHSGKTGVNYWFRDFIAPTLGNQAPLVQELQLNGHIDNADTAPITPASQRLAGTTSNNARANRVYGAEQIVQSNQPEFSGTAAPGSIIRLALSPAAKPMNLTLAGVTTANSNGHWSLTTRHPLGEWAVSYACNGFLASLATRPGLAIVPTQPLGRLVIDASPFVKSSDVEKHERQPVPDSSRFAINDSTFHHHFN